MNEMNIQTIADLKRCVQQYGFPKLPIRGFRQIYELELETLPKKPPTSIKDNRKAKNPYFLRYGERWVDKLKSSSSISKFCCITDMVWFMMKEGEKLTKCSVHEDDLFIVHDALVLMTAKETITWMIDNNYFHCLLILMNLFQDGTPYSGRPVGNIPKFMPLDDNLNKDTP